MIPHKRGRKLSNIACSLINNFVTILDVNVLCLHCILRQFQCNVIAIQIVEVELAVKTLNVYIKKDVIDDILMGLNPYASFAERLDRT